MKFYSRQKTGDQQSREQWPYQEKFIPAWDLFGVTLWLVVSSHYKGDQCPYGSIYLGFCAEALSVDPIYDLLTCGMGLRPPIHFTGAKVQLLDGNGSWFCLNSIWNVIYVLWNAGKFIITERYGTLILYDWWIVMKRKAERWAGGAGTKYRTLSLSGWVSH